MAEISLSGAKDTTLHAKARGLRTFLRFCYAEGYLAHPIGVTMPKLERRRLPCLDGGQLVMVLKACRNRRDGVIVHLLVDTGLRRAEACALNWGDVDLASGLVRVVRGKGGMARSVVVGARTRRELLAYRRTVDHNPDRPLLQTSTGTRLTPAGLRMVLRRLSLRSGVRVSPHALRRTFATLSLRAGMSPLHVQGLLGHSTLEMTRHYAAMIDDDLLEAHRKHGPMDTFL
jgi:integrase/recombinase XerD